MNTIIITGASSGIGREFAFALDHIMGAKIDEFWLIARRKDRLEELAATMHHDTRIFAMDVNDADAVESLTDELALRSGRVCMLINAAGYGKIGSFSDNRLSDVEGMIRLNVEALSRMTKVILPFMVRGGRIIQMASSASFMPQTGFVVYAASKAYVRSFSLGLNEELTDRRITVTAVCPGPVDTEFFRIAEEHGSTLAIKKYFMTTPQKVVRKALADSYHRRAESVPTLSMRALQVLCKLLPHTFLLRLFRLFVR
ncbi:MAG: SDR family NAD(P)-dependent oxidoreductase [Lachnospiraceae bacterium]|nr:SDR family NAD(P)-dependent oxidoreductase [Lachnospiraceae bacterium]